MRRWRGLRPGIRAGVVAVTLLIALAVGVELVDSATAGPEPDFDPRAPASSLSDSDTGASAYRALLARFGFAVRGQRGDLAGAGLDPYRDTLVVLDAVTADDGDAAALARFVDDGGHAVVAGWDAGLLDVVGTGRPPTTGAAGGGTVASVGPGRYRIQARDLQVFDRPGASPSFVLTERTGSGEVTTVADARPFLNENLAGADNAAFAVAVAGATGRTVVFAEGVHGHGRATGLDAVPARWRYALVAGVLASLLTLVAAGRRLGPPEDDDRDLGPGRELYATSLGASIERSRRPAEALDPLQALARADLARRAGLPPDAGEPTLREAAARLGWEADEIDALFRPADRPDVVLAAGRAAVRARKENP